MSLSSEPSEGCWHDFDVAIAQWLLGDLPADRLPDAATNALTVGCETESLGVLAAGGMAPSEIEVALQRVLAERGVELPAEPVAVERVANDVIQRMARGDFDADVGLRRLSRLSRRVRDTRVSDELSVFEHMELDWNAADQVGFDREALLDEVRRIADEISRRGGLLPGPAHPPGFDRRNPRGTGPSQ